MLWSRVHLRKGIVLLSCGVSFTLVAVSGWLTFVELPRIIYIHYLNSGGAVQTVNPYIFTLFYFQIPIRLAFYIAIGIPVLVTIRDHLRTAQGQLIPPYPINQQQKEELPIVLEATKKPLQKKFYNLKRGFGVTLILILVIDIVYLRWIQWNYKPISDFLQQLPTDILIGSLSFILSAPIQQFGGPLTAQMNAETLVATLFLIWIPIPPLIMSFLNLNSLLYDTTKKAIFLSMISVLNILDSITDSISTRIS